MKDNFIYVLSALLVIAVVLMQISTQAVTNAKDGKTMPQFEKDIRHLERGITGEGQNSKSDRLKPVTKNNK